MFKNIKTTLLNLKKNLVQLALFLAIHVRLVVLSVINGIGESLPPFGEKKERIVIRSKKKRKKPVNRFIRLRRRRLRIIYYRAKRKIKALKPCFRPIRKVHFPRGQPFEAIQNRPLTREEMIRDTERIERLKNSFRISRPYREVTSLVA